MKKYLIILLSIFALNSCEQDDTILEATADKKLPKVDVCHYDADTDTWKTLSVNGNALKAHLGHGDKTGMCGYTYVPDDGFERYLIWDGYDDVMDNYVLTANIINLTSLSIWGDPDFYIKDLTGIGDFKALENLYLGYHFFKEIDLTENINLKNLSLTLISYLENLVTPEQLILLNIDSCQSLKTLDVSKSSHLEGFSIYASVPIESIDLSNNANLKTLYFGICNYLKNINLKNGTNNLITDISFLYLDNTECVQVDSKAYSEANWTVSGCPKLYFSEDCGY